MGGVEPSRYVIALRRGHDADAPDDWVDRIAQIPGVSVIGTTGKRAQIEADDDGIGRVRAEHGSYAHIEPLIEHRPS